MKILANAAVFLAIVVILPTPLLAKDEPVKAQVAGEVSAMRPSADLTKSLEAYRQVTMNNDIEGILSFVYPAVFKLVPKEQIKTMLTQMYASGKAPVIKAINYDEIGPLRSYSKGQFTVIKYHTEIELPRPGDATPQIDETMIKLLKARMGPDTQVVIDEKRNVLNIRKFAILLAINEENAGWKVLEKQKLEMIKQEKLLPDDLVAQLK